MRRGKSGGRGRKFGLGRWLGELHDVRKHREALMAIAAIRKPFDGHPKMNPASSDRDALERFQARQ